MLLNVYSGDRTAADLERLLAWALDGRAALGPVDAGSLTLTAVDGRRRDTGIYARARRLPRPPR